MPDYRYDLAVDAYHRGRIDAAIELFKGLLADDPDSAPCHGMLAACLLAKMRLHAAEYELHLALGQTPNDSFLFVIEARLNMLRRRYQPALESCDRALSLAPEMRDALLMKALVYGLMNRDKEALAYLQRAVSSYPDSLAVQVALGNFWLEQGSLEKAAAFAREALNRDAGNEDANLLMGKLLLAQGDAEAAADHARFVIMNNPASGSALELLGQIKVSQSWLTGLWWRINAWISRLGNLKAMMVLIMAFLLFNLLAQILSDLSYGLAANIVSYAWLAIVIYSWVGLPLYQRALNTELEKFSFNRNF